MQAGKSQVISFALFKDFYGSVGKRFKGGHVEARVPAPGLYRNGGLQLSSYSRERTDMKEGEREATGLDSILTRYGGGQRRMEGAPLSWGLHHVPGRIMVPSSRQETSERRHKSEERGAVAFLSLPGWLRRGMGWMAGGYPWAGVDRWLMDAWIEVLVR